MNKEKPQLLLEGPVRGTMMIPSSLFDNPLGARLGKALGYTDTVDPRWSTVLPTESGWYWCRNAEKKQSFATELYLSAGKKTPRQLFSSVHCNFLTEIGNYGDTYEWWPIPIQPPK